MSAGRDIYAEQHSAFAVEEHLSGKPVRWGRWSLIVRRRNVLIWCLLLTLALSMAWLGLLQGTTKTDAGQVWAALTRPDDSSLTTIVWDLRLPRVVLGLLVGASLAASGAVFQSMSRNALGSPDIIGFLSGAAAGAVTAIIVFDAGPLAVAASAAGAGLLTAVLVLGLAHRGGSLGGERLVLVGVGVGALMQAVTTVLLTKTEPEVAIAGRIWLTGTLNARTWAEAAMAATGLLSCLPILILASRRLAALEMGDEMSMQGGAPVRSTRIVVGMAGTGLVALATAAAGPIAFIALAAPHLTRGLLRGGTVPITTSALMGAVLLVGADVLTQQLPSVLQVPVAVTTSIVGGLYLLAMLGRAR